jgi:hypothetical protein
MTTATGLPDFVIIGAVKGATTWLHNQLQDNPAIYLPGPEPHFFSQEFELGLDHYRAKFSAAKPGQIIGEKSADYFAHPQAAARLAKQMPGARLVLQLRNPIERAYSDYKMLYRRGTVTKGPEAYLTSLDCDQPRFLEDGLYAKHLKRWLDHFDGEALKILLFEDVKAAPARVVAEVSAHIQAPHHYSLEVGAKPRNDSTKQFLPLPMRTALAPFKQAVRPLRGTPMFEAARRVFAREIRYPPLSDSLQQRIADFYARDIEDLGHMIGRNLRDWTIPHRLVA